jgi:8-oxo-dGTP pyrophosphatase MutT (NUDIX family)
MSATEPRYRAVVRAHMILNSSGRILLTCRAPGLAAGGWWQVPGGHLEATESVLGCALRETLEEVGVVVAPADARFVHLSHYRTAAGASRLAVFFEATSWQGTPRNLEPDRCTALGFFDIGASPGPIVPYIAGALGRYHPRTAFAAMGWEDGTPSPPFGSNGPVPER